MNRYEALYNQLKNNGNLELPEIWLVCPKCVDAFLGKAGTDCRVCGSETEPAPLYSNTPSQHETVTA